jgi:hypothetical protein
MHTITLAQGPVKGDRDEPLLVHLTNERAGIVQTLEFDDLHELAMWLAEHEAEYRGRVGFLVPHDGELLRCLIKRGGLTWGWRYIQDHVAPLFERYRRLASRPRLRTPERYSHHSLGKAQSHAVRLSGDVRYEVVSGESGRRYTVTVRSSGSPRVQCTCPHGQWQARRRQDAKCSHAAAVQGRASSALVVGA